IHCEEQGIFQPGCHGLFPHWFLQDNCRQIVCNTNFGDTSLMLFQKFTYLVLFVFLALFNHANVSAQTVLLETSEGDITIKLDTDKAPATTANFLAYVEKG